MTLFIKRPLWSPQYQLHSRVGINKSTMVSAAIMIAATRWYYLQRHTCEPWHIDCVARWHYFQRRYRDHTDIDWCRVLAVYKDTVVTAAILITAKGQCYWQRQVCDTKNWIVTEWVTLINLWGAIQLVWLIGPIWYNLKYWKNQNITKYCIWEIINTLHDLLLDIIPLANFTTTQYLCCLSLTWKINFHSKTANYSVSLRQAHRLEILLRCTPVSDNHWSGTRS